MDCGARLDKAPEPEKKPAKKTAKKGEAKNDQDHR
jgi:hypothetical protein